MILMSSNKFPLVKNIPTIIAAIIIYLMYFFIIIDNYIKRQWILQGECVRERAVHRRANL